MQSRATYSIWNNLLLFDVASRKQMNIDNSLFPNPYEISDPVWRKDNSAFTFEYNQRGHQVYRVIEVNASGSLCVTC
jgi:hypothetical protein